MSNPDPSPATRFSATRQPATHGRPSMPEGGWERRWLSNSQRRTDWQVPFLEAFAAGPPTVRSAAKIAKIDPHTVKDEIARSPDFAAAFEVAKMMATDRLVEVAWELATGYEEDVFYKGIKVGTRIVQDPEMVKFLLRALIPETFDRGKTGSESSRYSLDRQAQDQMIADARERLALMGHVIDVEPNSA